MNLIGRAYQKIVRESGSLIRQTGGMAGMYNQQYRNASGGRIVVYHGICRKDHTRISPTFLELQTFEARLQFFKKHFKVVSLEEYFENKASIQFTVCLSFDDGLANNLNYVLPLLEKYQLPARRAAIDRRLKLIDLTVAKRCLQKEMASVQVVE